MPYFILTCVSCPLTGWIRRNWTGWSWRWRCKWFWTLSANCFWSWRLQWLTPQSVVEIVPGMTFYHCLWQGDKGLPGISGEKGNAGRRVSIFLHCYCHGKTMNISLRDYFFYLCMLRPLPPGSLPWPPPGVHPWHLLCPLSAVTYLHYIFLFGESHWARTECVLLK